MYLDEIRHIDFAQNLSKLERFSCIVRQCGNLQFSDCQVDRNAILGREEILILGLKKSRSEVRLYFRLTSITIEKTFWPPSAFSIILVTSLPHIGLWWWHYNHQNRVKHQDHHNNHWWHDYTDLMHLVDSKLWISRELPNLRLDWKFINFLSFRLFILFLHSHLTLRSAGAVALPTLFLPTQRNLPRSSLRTLQMVM